MTTEMPSRDWKALSCPILLKASVSNVKCTTNSSSSTCSRTMGSFGGNPIFVADKWVKGPV